MAVRHLHKIVEHLRSVVAPQDEAESDADLLKRLRQDEAAFEALVRKHGPMVMGVCQRILHNSHDAEDAFQATFLVLVRKASTIRPPSMVGNWLYGVAYRTALEARRSAAKRRAKEATVAPQTETPNDTWNDLRLVLDQELERLPEKYRAVVVLCDLEGKTRKEAAARLGWPEGTVASRLSTARTMLAKRLARHSFGLSAGVLAAMLAQNGSVCVPPSVVSATVKSCGLLAAGQTGAGVLSVEVAALTKGVLKTMFLSKLKMTATVLVMAGIIFGGGGLLALSTFGAGQPEAPEDPQSKKPEKQANRKDEVKEPDAAAKLRQAEEAFQAAEAKLREARAAVPEAAALVRLQELRNSLREQRTDLILLALELEKQKRGVKLLKERLEYVLMRATCNEEEKKSLVAAVRQVLDPLIEKIVEVSQGIEIMRQSNDEMLAHLGEGEQESNVRRLQQLKKELQGEKEYSDWPVLELDRVRERLRAMAKVGLERTFKSGQLDDEDKTFLVDTLNKETDPIIAKAEEIDRILGRVRVTLLRSLEDEKGEGTKE